MRLQRPLTMALSGLLGLGACSLIDLPEPGHGLPGAGGGDACALASDCPGEDTTCGARVCVNATCEIEPAPEGTACTEDGGVECDGDGACARLATGRECDDAGLCQSGECADGFCCDGACSGSCERCDAEGSEGSCGADPVGTDASEDCPGQAVCGGSSACIGETGWAVSLISEGPVMPTGLASGPEGQAVLVGSYEDTYWSNLTMDPLGLAVAGQSPYEPSVFVARVGAGGTTSGSWITAFLTTGNELTANGTAAAIDAQGDVYVAGTFSECSIDLNDGASYSTLGIASLLVKLDGSDGSTIWAKVLDNNADVRIRDIAVLPDGAVAAVGAYHESVDFGTTTEMSSGGSEDAFVVVYEPDGAERWVRSYGDAQAQSAVSVVALAGGEVALSGDFDGTIDFGNAGSLDAGAVSRFVVVVNAQGTSEWATAANGNNPSLALGALAAAADGDLVIGGTLAGSATFLGDTLTSAAPTVFVTKVSPSGDQRWLREFEDGTVGLLGYGHDWLAADGRDVVMSVTSQGPFVDFGLGPIGDRAASDNELFAARLDQSNGDTVLNYYFPGPAAESTRGTGLSPGAIHLGGTHRGMSFNGVGVAASGANVDHGFIVMLSN